MGGEAPTDGSEGAPPEDVAPSGVLTASLAGAGCGRVVSGAGCGRNSPRAMRVVSGDASSLTRCAGPSSSTPFAATRRSSGRMPPRSAGPLDSTRSTTMGIASSSSTCWRSTCRPRLSPIARRRRATSYVASPYPPVASSFTSASTRGPRAWVVSTRRMPSSSSASDLLGRGPCDETGDASARARMKVATSCRRRLSRKSASSATRRPLMARTTSPVMSIGCAPAGVPGCTAMRRREPV